LFFALERESFYSTGTYLLWNGKAFTPEYIFFILLWNGKAFTRRGTYLLWNGKAFTPECFFLLWNVKAYIPEYVYIFVALERASFHFGK